MIKNKSILSAIYMIQDYRKGSHFLEETVDSVLNELKLLDKELEALQQPKSCEGCKFYNFTYSHHDGAVRKFEVMCCDCIRSNTKDNYKPKEQ